MTKPYLITAGLPYANGSIHLGHLVEYLTTDVYARALRMAGETAYFVCADDTHGTPVELSAQKQGVSPEAFIARCAEEHTRDFADFEIEFATYSSTNSETNRAWVHEIYQKLKERGLLKTRRIEQLYDETAGRFLPDRFVKGTCPRCQAKDQYGDVCESCGRTYDPTELVEPYSVLTKTKPVLRASDHLYFDLATFADFLGEEAARPGFLQPEIKNFVDSWIAAGLKEWCISRDAPYFGFAIPDVPGKYFYVWLDAPIGYVSATTELGRALGRPDLGDEIWRKGGAYIHHVIGKDIVYFHALFWPAVLKAAGLALPKKLHVHGMLTVDGVKMSKSRGTFITARTYLERLEPSYLRYYYAAKTSRRPEDLDLNLAEFVARVNAELINNVVNLVSRGVPFLNNRLGGRYGRIPAGSEAILADARQKVAAAAEAYRSFEHGEAVRLAVELASVGNRLFQDGEPWKRVDAEPEAVRDLVTLCLNLARAAVVILAPAVPSLAERMSRMLGLPGGPSRFEEATRFDLVDRPAGEVVRILNRLETKDIEGLVLASKAPAEAPPAEAAARPPIEPIAPEIGKEKLDEVDLRVGLVLAAEEVAGADKLLRLTIDLGEPKPRNIFAGIKSAYSAASLVGKRVAVVANLKPRKMKFGVSEGMVLAAGPGGKDIWLLELAEAAPPGAKIQ